MIREIVELDGANPYARRIEFYCGDEVLGYADYSLIYDRMELDQLFVEESKRRNGIGKKLPIIQIGIASQTGTSQRAAAISPPRSSKIGNNDTKKQNNCPFICSVSFNILINDSITFSYRSLLLKYYILIYSIYQ